MPPHWQTQICFAFFSNYILINWSIWHAVLLLLSPFGLWWLFIILLATMSSMT